MGSSSLLIYGMQDPATLKIIACREALTLAEDLGVQNVVISSDAKQVIQDLNNVSRGRYGAIIEEIQARSANFTCNFMYESRSVNIEAHKLARFSLSLDQGRHMWLVQPHDKSCIPHSVVYDQ